jgi:hypothetical protein
MSSQPDKAHQAAAERLNSQRAFWRTLGGFVLIWIVCTIIWAATGAGMFWPVWVILGTGIATLFMGWSAFGPRNTGPSQAQVDEEAKKFET